MESENPQQTTEQWHKHAAIVETLRDDPRNGHEAGTQFVEFGSDPSPDYSVLTDDGPKLITHAIVHEMVAPRPLTRSEWEDKIEDEVLPLEEHDE